MPPMRCDGLVPNVAERYWLGYMIVRDRYVAILPRLPHLYTVSCRSWVERSCIRGGARPAPRDTEVRIRSKLKLSQVIERFSLAVERSEAAVSGPALSIFEKAVAGKLSMRNRAGARGMTVGG